MHNIHLQHNKSVVNINQLKLRQKEQKAYQKHLIQPSIPKQTATHSPSTCINIISINQASSAQCYKQPVLP